MKVGVIGSGGREHAICVSLKESSKVEKIYCFPGNAGTSEIAKNVTLNLDNFENIFDLCLSAFPFLCLIPAQCECPAMIFKYFLVDLRIHSF